MARDALAAVSFNVTPQTQPAPGRRDQVKNNAGGYVFEKDDWRKLKDFLIIGSTGGTYYVDERKLTLGNVDTVIKLAKSNGAEVANLATSLSCEVPVRVLSNRGCLFALAAASAFGDAEAVQAVKRSLPQVARTTDHLSMFFGYRKQLKGKSTPRGTAPVSSRAYKSTLGAWFMAADPDQIAFRACKARQRKTPAGEDLDLRDVVRMAHVRPESPARNALLGWLVGKVSDEDAAKELPSVDKFLRAKAASSPVEAIRLVTELKVPWEFLPSEVLSDPGVWEVLAGTTGITAVIRNLARMTRIGTIRPMAAANGIITHRLTDPMQLKHGRVHPMAVYLAMRVYASGASQPNLKAQKQFWTPVGDILDALEEAYELSFGHVSPSGRKVLLAVDSSGSMMYGQVTANGSDLGTAYQVANAVALTMKRIEGDNLHVIDADTKPHASVITKRTRLAELRDRGASGGGTDMSVPFTYAMRYGLDSLDGFAILTDGETWAGNSHVFQRFSEYQRTRNAAARAAVATMVPNGWSLFSQEENVLNIAGIDASLPLAITGFLRGDES